MTEAEYDAARADILEAGRTTGGFPSLDRQTFYALALLDVCYVYPSVAETLAKGLQELLEEMREGEPEL